jgi:phage shock protein A
MAVKTVDRTFLQGQSVELFRAAIKSKATLDPYERRLIGFLKKMRAKSQAMDEMIDSGVLTDYTSNKDDIERELEKVSIKGSVEEELAKIKADQTRKKKKSVELGTDSSSGSKEIEAQ